MILSLSPQYTERASSVLATVRSTTPGVCYFGGPLFRVFFVKEDEKLGGGAREGGGTDRYKALQGRVALKP